MNSDNRVLVLGATGFVGRHVRAVLEASGWQVHAPSLARGSADRASALAQALREARPGVVVNCVGRTHGTVSELIDANVTFVGDLLGALAAGVRLVHIGSAAEYGDGGDSAIRESDAASPTSSYGATKLAATTIVMLERSDAVVLRVFNPIGAGMSQHTMPGRAVTSLRAALTTGAESVTMGDLSAERDYFAVRDVGQAVHDVLATPEATGIVNIGSGRATSSREVLRLIAQAADYRGVILENGAVSERSRAVARQVADVSLARSMLGWMPRHTIQQATRELWEMSSQGPA